MLIIIIVLACLSGILMLHLIQLKRNIRKLRLDFKEATSSQEAQRNVTTSLSDKGLERLAAQINQYIGEYYEEQARCRQNVKEIRSEITNLSHDLRTPLTSILGYLELLKPEELKEEQLQILAVVKRRGYQLNDLINELYEYARLENQEYVMRQDRLDFYRMVKEHLLEAYLEFEQAGIDLTPDLPEQSKAIWILADEKCLERVLANLTSNTIKYSTGEAMVSLREEKDWVCLTYRTLRGELSDYDGSHLFDRFYRKDTSRTDVKSSGLGLTIAKLMVEQMNGRIYANSDRDNLYITVRLPIQK